MTIFKDYDAEYTKALRVFLHAFFRTYGGEVRIPTSALQSATGDFRLLWFEDRDTNEMVYKYKDNSDPAPAWETGEVRDGFINIEEFRDRRPTDPGTVA